MKAPRPPSPANANNESPSRKHPSLAGNPRSTDRGFFSFHPLHTAMPGLKVGPLPTYQHHRDLPRMNAPLTAPMAALEKPTRVRYGVLGFACSLSMITYLDRVCFGTVAPIVQSEFGLIAGEARLPVHGLCAWPTPCSKYRAAGWATAYGARTTLIRIVLWWSIFTALTGSIYPTPDAFMGVRPHVGGAAFFSAWAKRGRIQTSPVLSITGFLFKSVAGLRGRCGWRAALPAA